VSSSAVFSVGIGHGPIVWNWSTTPAGPAFGQVAWKSGQRMVLWSRSPSQGVVIDRA
jgi:hypothetical protein